MAPADERSVEQHRSGKYRSGSEFAKHALCRGQNKNNFETLSLGRWRRKLGWNNGRCAPGTWHWRGGSTGCLGESKKPANCLLGQRGLLEIDRWRENLGRLEGRARW